MKKQARTPVETDGQKLNRALRGMMVEYIKHKTIRAEGLFEVAMARVPKRNKKDEDRFEPKLVQTDVALIFRGATWKGVPVPQEPFVRIQLVKPIFEKVIQTRIISDGNAAITDAYIEMKGNAMETVFKICMQWKRIYDDYAKVKVSSLPVLTEDRIGEIMSFFRFEGNRLYIADPEEPRHYMESLEFLRGKGFYRGNGKGKHADVKAVITEPIIKS
ncbi:MAG: hypothetical protein NTX79_08885 [Candidatus Micrarchaeota archaeon]|nr:hypothetical protein [Candidatus Micrarchaeota archaeon]